MMPRTTLPALGIRLGFGGRTRSGGLAEGGSYAALSSAV